MSYYQVGAPCEDCLSSGLQNYLKLFYINLDEQITKCESSSCMYPYLRKSKYTSPMAGNSTENILNLDEFIEENAKTLNTADTEKSNIQSSDFKAEDVPIMFDFSALFADKSFNEVSLTQSKQTSIANTCKEEQVQFNSIKTEEKNPHIPVPPKARITRCLSNVKSNPKKATKSKNKKIEPVLVIEPQSGKTMRPLDLIQHYIRNKNSKN